MLNIAVKRLDVVNGFLDIMFDAVKESSYKLHVDGCRSFEQTFRHLKYNDKILLEQLIKQPPASGSQLIYPVSIVSSSQIPVNDLSNSHISYELAYFSEQTQLKMVYEGLRLSQPESGMIAGAGFLVYSSNIKDCVNLVHFIKRTKRSDYGTQGHPGDIISEGSRINDKLKVLEYLKNII